MNKRIFSVLATLVLIASLLLAGGCSGTNTMLMGRWKLSTYGDGAGDNQQNYPIPFTIDIYPDGHVDLLESHFGTYTKNRDTFTFTTDDKTLTMSGSFVLDYPKLTVYSDQESVSYVLEKVADYQDLLKLISAKKAESAAPAATTTATPAPTATN